MERLLIVSADGHVGARPETYRQYLDPQFRDTVDDLVVETADWNRMTKHEDLAGNSEFPGWDLPGRLRALDDEGVAAEIVHPGVQGSMLPFFTGASKPCSRERQWAGTRAYHRWLADWVADSEGRLFGIGAAGPCVDVGATVDELRWIADHGFVGVLLPQYNFDPERPALHDLYYEPFWATCEELGLRLSLHAGWGIQQGRFWEFAARFAKQVVGQSDEKILGGLSEEAAELFMGAMAAEDDSPLALDLGARRVLWQLMVGGVFDRHPGLTLVVTELRADWLPATLAALDARCREVSAPMELLPSEYWVRNCFITPSSIHECEVQMRHEIGVDRMLFGTDCPHPEATYPQTAAWMRHTLRGVPEDETRAILGENAIRCYGLDRIPLDRLAARIGPTVEDVVGGAPVDDALLADFDRRAGLRRPAEEIDAASVRELLDEDLVAVGAEFH